jgi:hypoxanthine phosphoribosyltransferase
MTAGDGLRVLFTEDEIRSRVKELGRRITRDVPQQAQQAQRSPGSTGGLACVGILPNSMVFMADLIRAIELPLTCDFLKVGSSDARRVDIAFGSATDFSGRDVLLIQGVVDTGVTLSFITGHIQETWKPRSLKVVALINREAHRKVDCPVDYACFELEKEGFVAGYGLGFEEQHRGAPFIGFAPV